MLFISKYIYKKFKVFYKYFVYTIKSDKDSHDWAHSMLESTPSQAKMAYDNPV